MKIATQYPRNRRRPRKVCDHPSDLGRRDPFVLCIATRPNHGRAWRTVWTSSQQHRRQQKHAIINYTKKKNCLYWCWSTNGTFVNHKRISQPTMLSRRLHWYWRHPLASKGGHKNRTWSHARCHEQCKMLKKTPDRLIQKRLLESQLPKVIDQRQQLGEPISCVFVDLTSLNPSTTPWSSSWRSSFKTISNIIQSIIRKQDPCIRYGGDEMLIIYPKVTELRAKTSVERIRQQIVATPWHRIAQGLSVSASFGVAEYRGDRPVDSPSGYGSLCS